MREDTEAHDRAIQRAVDEHGWCYLHSALADDCKGCRDEHDEANHTTDKESAA